VLTGGVIEQLEQEARDREAKAHRHFYRFLRARETSHYPRLRQRRVHTHRRNGMSRRARSPAGWPTMASQPT